MPHNAQQMVQGDNVQTTLTSFIFYFKRYKEGTINDMLWLRGNAYLLLVHIFMSMTSEENNMLNLFSTMFRWKNNEHSLDYHGIMTLNTRTVLVTLSTSFCKVINSIFDLLQLSFVHIWQNVNSWINNKRTILEHITLNVYHITQGDQGP